MMNLFILLKILIVISEMSYIHGVIFPKPFSDDPDSSRAAKNLLVLIFTVLIMVNLYIKNNKFPHSLKFILLLVLATSFLSLIYIFGRSDGPHIKNIFGFSIIFIGIFLFFYVLKIIDDRFKNNLNRRNIEYFSIIIILFSFYLNLNFNLKNISSFNERLSTYVKYDDSKFVQEDYINLVSNSKNFLSKADCVQLYTNDVGILYLLRKKNCTKYYFVWSVGSSDTQLDMIKEMNNTNFIISNGKTDNWDVPLNKKLYLIDEYINKNFEEVTDISGFKILERNN